VNCRCGHAREQHSRILRICMASNFAALAGVSPLTGRTCIQYRPATPLRWRAWIARLTRKNQR
jgi:hypothetical protein